MTLVDSNVLIDLFTDGEVWADWSDEQLERAATVGPLFINDIVYAEVSVRFDSVRALAVELASLNVEVANMPREALVLADKTFLKYRAAGGIRLGVLPDFFIGAHAAVAGLPLLTRDVRRYRYYFPTLKVMSPDHIEP